MTPRDPTLGRRIRRGWPLLLAVACALAAAFADAQALPRDVRLRILQAVVEVIATDDDGGESPGAGSGTIVSADGFVLTNYHVVEDENGRPQTWHVIRVTDPSAPDREPEHRYWARYVDGDPSVDLALLKIVEYADETPIPPGTPFVYMSVGEASLLLPGDPITVVGFPGVSGATVTFTQGIVSGFVGEDLLESGKRWIKTDAKLARGNSGGGAFNQDGVLIGVPTMGVQTFESERFEDQDYLRPIDLALPLFARHGVAVERVGATSAGFGAVAGAAITPRPGATPPPPLPGASASGRLTGRLDASDLALDGGEYFDVHSVVATAGARVTVTLTSSTFDPYLLIFGPDEALIAEVDDTPALGLGAEATFVAPTSGTYLIGVTSAFAAEVGAYDLVVRGGTVTEGFAFAPAQDGGVTTAIVIDGRLDRASEQLRSGEYAAVHEVTLAAGETLRVFVTSTDLDPYLIVRGPNGATVLEVDDSPGAGILVDELFTATTAGVYRFVVTTYQPGETGTYRLEVRGVR